MLIESLARLTLLHEECKSQNIVINSSEFMDDTQSVIDSQIELMQRDLSFQVSNPGPYAYGVGKFSIHIFPPTFTESADWVLIVIDEQTQTKERLFVFHSLLGLIENLANAFKYIETQNACTTEQDRKSETETRSVSPDPIANSDAKHV